jgi:hypothetical protein
MAAGRGATERARRHSMAADKGATEWARRHSMAADRGATEWARRHSMAAGRAGHSRAAEQTATQRRQRSTQASGKQGASAAAMPAQLAVFQVPPFHQGIIVRPIAPGDVSHRSCRLLQEHQAGISSEDIHVSVALRAPTLQLPSPRPAAGRIQQHRARGARVQQHAAICAGLPVDGTAQYQRCHAGIAAGSAQAGGRQTYGCQH